MAQGKFTDNVVRLRCEKCKRVNYHKHKNKKKVERKLQLQKYCSWCKVKTLHKEAKK